MMRNPLSKKITGIEPSGIRKFFDLVSEMPDAISLGVGEPDFDTPWHIRDEGIYSLEKGRTFYTSNAGLKELKIEIDKYLKRRFGVSYDYNNEIMVTVGGSEAIDIAMRAMLDPGDEVLIPQPSYVSYLPCCVLANGTPVIIELKAENQFRLTPEELEAAITPKTKLLVLPFPNNPTGAIMEKEDLEKIAEVVKKYDLFVLSDEIYSELTYTGNNHVTIASLPGMKERTILINGFSKSYAMTGWRIGFIAGPEWIVKACNKLQGQYTSGPCSVSQKAAEAAYTGSQAPVEEMRKAFERRRNLIVKLAKEVPGFEVNVPEGAFYLFPKCSSFFGKSVGDRKIENSDDLAMYLLEDAHVACVGGTSFGAPECIRMSYATSDENIVEAIRRIKEALAKLK